MIVKMRHLDLVCVASEKEATLEKLRELGAIHLDLSSGLGDGVSKAQADFSEAEKAVRLILKARGKATNINLHERTIEDIVKLDADATILKEEIERLVKEVNFYEPFGDFDPTLAKKLLDAGIEEIKAKLPEKLPEMRLSRIKEKLARLRNRLAIDNAKLAGSDESAILKRYPKLKDQMAFEQAKALLSDHGEIIALSGWLPHTLEDRFLVKAHGEGWGVLVRDPVEGEVPPTLIEPPKLFRPVKVLFEGLGIAPAYDEADVSVPFLCYFSLFFAMLVGDGAYGAIFLLGTLALKKQLPKAWFILLSVFSTSTIIWGILSNTWFGAGISACTNWTTVKWLADPSYHNMMLLCFTIGVSHLMLARVWNGICKLNDTSSLAEFGWAGVLLFMYFVTNSIVGIFKGVPTWAFWVFGVSLVLVFGFTIKFGELKTRGAELGMLPLNIMSALGDIISYVRLFAVGLASVKVAENFNAMATGLVEGENVWYVKALFMLAMALILIVGHALNLAMAGLSILVHAVRLNTLEFSNHKGVSWAGYAFRPFKKVKE